MLWNGSVILSSPIHQHICTIPYDGLLYSLLSVNLVVQGSGPLYLYLIDAISTKVVFENKETLIGKENQVHMISISSFQNLKNEHSVLTLHMHTEHNIVKVVSVSFSM